MTTSAQDDTQPIYLSPDVLKPVGFDQEDGLSPTQKILYRLSPAHRMFYLRRKNSCLWI